MVEERTSVKEELFNLLTLLLGIDGEYELDIGRNGYILGEYIAAGNRFGQHRSSRSCEIGAFLFCNLLLEPSN